MIPFLNCGIEKKERKKERMKERERERERENGGNKKRKKKKGNDTVYVSNLISERKFCLRSRGKHGTSHSTDQQFE